MYKAGVESYYKLIVGRLVSLTFFRCYQIYCTVLLHSQCYLVITLTYKLGLNFVQSIDRLKEC